MRIPRSIAVSFLLAVLLLSACFDVPVGLQDQLDQLAIEEEVAFVNCAPPTLELAIGQTGTCDALNADSTRLAGFTAVWTSSIPSAVTVDTNGELRAETLVSNNVVITAKGANDSSAFFVVATF